MYGPGTTAAAGLPGAGAWLGPANIVALAALGAGGQRKMANVLTENFQTKFFNDVLKPAAELAKSDPTAAQAMVAQEWPKFLGDVDKFMQSVPSVFSGQAQKVVGQMFKTPEFINTVGSLLGSNPLASTYTAPFMSTQSGSGPQSRGLSSVIPAVAQTALGVAGQLIGAGGRGSGDNLDIPAPVTPPYVGNTSPQLPGGAATAPPIAAPGRVPGAQRGGISGLLDSLFSKKNIPDLISGGSTLLSSILQGRAATGAAALQTNAANKAAELESEASKNSLDFLKQVYGDQTAANKPFLEAGTNALGEVQKLIGPGGELSSPFTAPTAEEVRTTPGYQLKLDEAMKALGRRTHGVMSGPAVKQAEKFASDYADQGYDTATKRALDIFQTNRSNRLNPLLTIAGYGPQAVAAGNQSGTNATNQNTGILTNTAENLGNLGQSAAYQTAAGNVASTNALSAALAAISNLAQQRRNTSGYAQV